MNHRIFLRPFIWLKRFRNRCGYGVHSPFAFNLITFVIYQKTPYYNYASLKKEERRLSATSDKNWRYEPTKVKRLLFRLANYVKANHILDVGTLAASSLYLKAARTKADYQGAQDAGGFFLEPDVPIDFLYLHDYRHPEKVEESFLLCVSRATANSMFVIEGIGYSQEMYALWKRMQQHNLVGITFDLYDVGILCFDHTKLKQHYIVNF